MTRHALVRGQRRKPNGTTNRTPLAASAALATAMLPTFLVAALGAEIREELQFDEAALGATITVMFVTAGFLARAIAHAVDRGGARTALRAGVVVSGLATAAIGAFTNSWWQLAAFLSMAGLAVSLIDVGTARLFAERLPHRRLGTAFGVKEASIPMASMAAGLALPTIASALGWRPTFIAALALTVPALLLVRIGVRPQANELAATSRRPTPDGAGAKSSVPVTRSGDVGETSIARLAVGASLGAAAATASATFLVQSMDNSGFSASQSGLALAAASLVSVAVRIVMGRWADRAGVRPQGAMAALLVAGAIGAVLLASSNLEALVAIGGLFVLGAGWGWTGLAYFVATTSRPNESAKAASVVLTGLSIGAAGGPLAFGLVVGDRSYTIAWVVVAVALAVAAAISSGCGPSRRRRA